MRVETTMARIVPALLLLCAVPLACKHVPTEQEVERAGYARDLGVSAMHKQDYRQALSELTRALELNPDDPEAHYALGLTYFSGFNRLNEAEDHLRKAVALRAKFSDAENALGNVLMAKGNCDAAIPFFERAMSNLVWPTPYLAEQNLGWCLYRTGKQDQGINHLKSAVNIQPQLCGGYDYLARIYAERGDQAEIIRWLEKYLQHCDTEKLRGFLAPGQLSSVFFRLGMAALRSEAKDNARTYFATCAERFKEEDVAAECRKNLALLE